MTMEHPHMFSFFQEIMHLRICQDQDYLLQSLQLWNGKQLQRIGEDDLGFVLILMNLDAS